MPDVRIMGMILLATGSQFPAPDRFCDVTWLRQHIAWFDAPAWTKSDQLALCSV